MSMQAFVSNAFRPGGLPGSQIGLAPSRAWLLEWRNLYMAAGTCLVVTKTVYRGGRWCSLKVRGSRVGIVCQAIYISFAVNAASLVTAWTLG